MLSFQPADCLQIMQVGHGLFLKQVFIFVSSSAANVAHAVLVPLLLSSYFHTEKCFPQGPIYEIHIDMGV